MSAYQKFRGWAKYSPSPLAVAVRQLHQQRNKFEMPSLFIPLYKVIRILHSVIHNFISTSLRIGYYTPLFKSQIHSTAPQLYLYGGLPFISGPLNLQCGRACRISGATTFSARAASQISPQLIIGNRVGIGWQTTIAVGSKVIFEDDVRIAGRSFFAGYPGHPIDAKERAAGKPDHDDQVGDIILKKDVWLGTGVMVMAGITIGEGTIVAAGSIVTKSLPSHVIAAGNPARVIRKLHSSDKAKYEKQHTVKLEAIK